MFKSTVNCVLAVSCVHPDAEETTQRLHPPNGESASCEISPPAGERQDKFLSVLDSGQAFLYT